jgi:hypothetical protein
MDVQTVHRGRSDGASPGCARGDREPSRRGPEAGRGSRGRAEGRARSRGSWAALARRFGVTPPRIIELSRR